LTLALSICLAGSVPFGGAVVFARDDCGAVDSRVTREAGTEALVVVASPGATAHVPRRGTFVVFDGLSWTLLVLTGDSAEAEFAFALCFGGVHALAGNAVARLDCCLGRIETFPAAITGVGTDECSGTIRATPTTGTLAAAVDKFTVSSAGSVDLAPLADPAIFTEALVVQADTMTGAVLITELLGAVGSLVACVALALAIFVALTIAGAFVGALNAASSTSETWETVACAELVRRQFGGFTFPMARAAVVTLDATS